MTNCCFPQPCLLQSSTFSCLFLHKDNVWKNNPCRVVHFTYSLLYAAEELKMAAPGKVDANFCSGFRRRPVFPGAGCFGTQKNLEEFPRLTLFQVAKVFLIEAVQGFLSLLAKRSVAPDHIPSLGR